MAVKEKKTQEGRQAPHERYIGFTTSVPDIDVEEYGRRWRERRN